MKFLQIHTFYDGYLREFSERNPHLGVASHDKAMKTLLADGFSACHLIAPHLESSVFDSTLLVGNFGEGQKAWQREHAPGQAFHTGADLLRRQVEQWAPDVLYITDPVTYDSAFVRSLSKRPPLVMGWRAAPIPDSTDWSEFDVMVSNHAPTLSLALERGAATVARFHPGFPRFIADAVRDEREGADAVFCGQWSPAHAVRNRTWLDLAKATLSQPRDFSLEYYLACHAPRALPSAVSMFNKGGRFGLDMHRALKRGRICLNAMIDMAQGMSANMRLFEIAGTGAFQLMEYHSDIGQYFEPDVEIATYRDGNELIEKLFYYLDHPEERREIARRGQERCLTDHGMARRVLDFQELTLTALKRVGTPSGRNVQTPQAVEPVSLAKVARDKDKAAKAKLKSLQKKLTRAQKRLERKETEVTQIKRTVSWKLLKGVFSIEKRVRRLAPRPKPAPKIKEGAAPPSKPALSPPVAETTAWPMEERPVPYHCPACHSAQVRPLAELSYGDTFYKWGVPSYYQNRVKTRFGDLQIPIHACENCGLHFVPAQPRGVVHLIESDPNYFSLVVAGYLDESQPLVNQGWLDRLLAKDPAQLSAYDQHHRYLIEYLARWVSSSKSYLDLGSNMGALAEMVRIKYHPQSVSCCELNEHYCDVLAKRYPELTLYRGPLGENVGAAKFDVIYCSDVIEHIWNLDEFLAAITAHLADDGRLILVTPHVECEAAQKNGFAWWGYIVPHHCQLFSRRSMTALLTRVGLEPEEFVPHREEFLMVCRKTRA